jgi:hypothetical protein
MWYILCGSNDQPAIWAYEGLKAAGLEPLEVVSAEMLGAAESWDHFVGKEGAHIDIKLPDGRVIYSKEISGVLNRLLMISPSHLHAAAPSDREYAIQEFSAFFCSWLYCLPGKVINRPTPQGLSGGWRHISEWVYLAGLAGLPALDYRKKSRDVSMDPVLETRLVPYDIPFKTLFAVDGEVTGPQMPGEIYEGCRKLQELSGSALLGIEFIQDAESGWRFVGATPSPDLRLGGDDLLDRLGKVLKNRGGERL